MELRARSWLWVALYCAFIFWLMSFLNTAHASDLDIAIIGDDYISQDNFRTDAEKVASYILSYVPFSEYASNIKFVLVSNQDDLYCKPSPTMSRLVTCDESVVRNKLTALGITWDKIIVIWNNPNYGGSGGSMTVVYNGSYMTRMAIHEFAHSFGGLLDEYLLYATNAWEKDQAMMNCWCMAKEGWFKGCNYPNWYRSTSCSIMKDLNCNYFNDVSKEVLRTRLNIATGKPNVALSANPLDGRAPLTVTFTVEVSGNAPFSYSWSF